MYVTLHGVKLSSHGSNPNLSRLMLRTETQENMRVQLISSVKKKKTNQQIFPTNCFKLNVENRIIEQRHLGRKSTEIFP